MLRMAKSLEAMEEENLFIAIENLVFSCYVYATASSKRFLIHLYRF